MSDRIPTRSSSRAASVAVTPLLRASSRCSSASRVAMVLDSRDSPTSVVRTSSGVSRKVSASVENDRASCCSSIFSTVVDRPWKASATS